MTIKKEYKKFVSSLYIYCLLFNKAKIKDILNVYKNRMCSSKII